MGRCEGSRRRGEHVLRFSMDDEKGPSLYQARGVQSASSGLTSGS